MSIFRRRVEPLPERVRRFWAWWAAGGSDEVLAALRNEDVARIERLLAGAVAALHRDGVSWQLGPAAEAEATLIVTGEGEPERCAVAAEWLRQAPAPDARWAFADRRPGLAAASLEFQGVVLTAETAEVTWAVNPEGRWDVRMSHPALDGWPEDDRSAAAFMLLDIRLGEEAIDKVIGFIDADARPLPGGRPLDELAGAIEQELTTRVRSTGR